MSDTRVNSSLDKIELISPNIRRKNKIKIKKKRNSSEHKKFIFFSSFTPEELYCLKVIIFSIAVLIFIIIFIIKATTPSSYKIESPQNRKKNKKPKEKPKDPEFFRNYMTDIENILIPKVSYPNIQSKSFTFPFNINDDTPPAQYQTEYFYKMIKKNIELSRPFSEICYNSIEDRFFINGVIRKYRPKKLLEIGAKKGCTSSIILNAINDIEGAFLYSIDKNLYIDGEKVGVFVKDNFSELLYKWELYQNSQIIQVIEKIGNEIEFVLLDNKGLLPGEALDFLEVLPFLAENAIVVLHDINYGFIYENHQMRSSNNILFSNLRGKKIIPKPGGKNYFMYPCGAVILENNQKKNFFDYFFVLSSSWDYLPTENEFILLVRFLEKYYERFYIDLFIEIYKSQTRAKLIDIW